jgi:hypothetical protein
VGSDPLGPLHCLEEKLPGSDSVIKPFEVSNI